MAFFAKLMVIKPFLSLETIKRAVKTRNLKNYFQFHATFPLFSQFSSKIISTLSQLRAGSSHRARQGSLSCYNESFALRTLGNRIWDTKTCIARFFLATQTIKSCWVSGFFGFLFWLNFRVSGFSGFTKTRPDGSGTRLFKNPMALFDAYNHFQVLFCAYWASLALTGAL